MSNLTGSPLPKADNNAPNLYVLYKHGFLFIRWRNPPTNKDRSFKVCVKVKNAKKEKNTHQKTGHVAETV